ncbi:Werner Syndrome-like exonuclease [Trametes pubescens]|uniref:Werner Syndrome-like exonuclease n=2 Tax=Trametes pubescens TaxID=154538 RepID=A0A1M2W2N6_TRAPU|nr:Werner Syndrome-like exonuclease [Trametes pubescens]
MDSSSSYFASGSHSHHHGAPAEPQRVYDLYSWSNISPNTRLVYCQNADAANEAVAQLNSKVLGFDLEWKPNFIKGRPENPVALVQLASADLVLLIHIFHMPTFPERLRDLLADETVVKAGVGIQKDCKKLFTDYGVDTRNCVDLSLLARTVDNARWKGKYASPIGLARLCETYEELTLQKGRVQTSNWELPLDLRQQDYAANDSHAGLTLYTRLSAMATTMDPVPQTVWYTFDTINGFLYQPSSGTVWHPFNPYYDPGPPPPPRPPRVYNDSAPNGAMPIPYRANRYSRRNRARNPNQPGSLSPSASSFVPGARTHTPSPSPTPAGGPPQHSYAVSPSSQPHAYTRSPPPQYRPANQSTPAPLMDIDMDGFPRLAHVPRQYQGKPKGFGGGGYGAHPHAGPNPGPPGRGRGRGRGRGQTVQLGFFAVSG